jgi:uncharacterized repeat protein (TIGR03803 family)
MKRTNFRPKMRRLLTILTAILMLAGRGLSAELKEKILHRFVGSSDGSNPQAGLISDKSGNLYGTSYYGGTGGCNVNYEFYGCGTVFELSPKSGGLWTETVLYNFANSPTDGQYPVAGLVLDQAGNLYGATGGGGTKNCGYGGCGTVFELVHQVAPGGVWTETILYNFQGGSDGLDPLAGLIFDKKGSLYGTTVYGGNYQGVCSEFQIGCGTIFKLTPSKSGGGWTETVLYRFKPTGDGFAPEAALVFDPSGALFGTTLRGGFYSSFCGSGCGTVFRLTPPAKRRGAWSEAIVHEFTGSDGGSPLGAVIFDRTGNLYGTTSVGLLNGRVFSGTVFRLSPPRRAGNWTESVLIRFGTSGGPEAPAAGVILDQAGNLYGTTLAGGRATFGTVFRLAPPSKKHGAWTETTLHQFIDGSDGAFPEAGLVLGKGAALYGTTYSGGDAKCSKFGYDACGVVFELIP